MGALLGEFGMWVRYWGTTGVLLGEWVCYWGSEGVGSRVLDVKKLFSRINYKLKINTHPKTQP
jgi:hypothetical protein